MVDSLVAIITDVKYRMSLAVIRDLGAAGVRVISCHKDDGDGSPPLGFFSKYTSERHTLPADGYEDALYDLCKVTLDNTGKLPALLPVGASTLAMLAVPETHARFSSVCGLCMPTEGQLSLLNDKGRVAELAITLGIPVPAFYAIEDGESIDSFFDRIPLPCVIKPRWGEGLGLTAALRYTIAQNPDELRQSYEDFSRLAGEPPLVQEYLPGEAKGCSVLAHNGKIIRKISHKRVREYPVTGGPSTCCDTVHEPQLEDIAAQLADAVGLTGLSMFEFKDDSDGKPRLLEVNPRVWGSYPLTRIAKTDFTYAWFTLSWNNGNPGSPIICQTEKAYRSRRMLFFPSDLASAKGYIRAGKSKLALRAVFDLLRPGTKDGLFEWSDARPALRYWRSLLKRNTQQIIENTEREHSVLHIDLHVHTTLSSDGRATKEMLARSAASRGLDAIVLTDHDVCALEAPERCEGIWLLPGCEISTDAGHILGLFFDRPPDIASLRSNGVASATKAVSMLRECGAVTVLAHPFIRENARPDAPVDCIESANSRVYFKNPRANAQAETLALSLNLPMAAGSDAHAAGEVGNAYTVFEAPDFSLPELRNALLSGRCRPVLVKNTPRRLKGLSQFRQARRSRNPLKLMKGLAYIGYCMMLDIFRGTKS